ncbi:hypothetical protein GCM10023080_089480 [Streptomyces pseudoechinosporeus]
MIVRAGVTQLWPREKSSKYSPVTPAAVSNTLMAPNFRPWSGASIGAPERVWPPPADRTIGLVTKEP